MEAKQTNKKSTKQVKSESVVAPATPAPVQAPVVAETKTTKVSAKKSTPASAVATPAPAPVVKNETPSVVTATVVESVATEAKSEVVSVDELESLAQEMVKTSKRFLDLARQVKKDYSKQVKKAEQGGGRRRNRKSASGEGSSHSNSVFLQPCRVSPALAGFCGVAADAMISRTDATRKIADYIRVNNLQNPENRREIRADATLTKLFSLTAEDKLNYFNLQRFIKPHFIKEVKA